MKKLLLLSVLCLVFSCNGDLGTVVRELSVFEQDIIPADQAETVVFINELDEMFDVEISEKRTGNSLDIHEGVDFQLMSQYNNYAFNDGMNYILWVGKTSENFTNLTITIFEGEYTELGQFAVNSCLYENGLSNLEILLDEVSVGELVYSNVFRFIPCPSNQTDIVQFIYSIERGIEYIEFEDGRFYKRI